MIEFQGRFDSSNADALNKRAFKKMWWLFIICAVALAGTGIFIVVLAEDYSDTVAGIILISFGVLFAPLVKLLTNLIQKRMNKSMNILSSDTVQVYQFFPDKLVITQRKGDEYEATTTAKYSYLYKVGETATTYFLFVSKMQSHVVNKSDLTQGTLEELNGILYTNLGTKFKKLK